MKAASHICTACGYEGKPVRAVDDSAGEGGNETRDAFDRLSRTFTVLTFIPIKPLAMLLAIPLYIVLWPIKRLVKGDGRKWCPNCSLPTMVRMESDAGWLAKRKNDLKAGLVLDQPKEEKVAFGSKIELPEDASAPRVAPPPPEKLPSLDTLLEQAEKDGATPPDTAEKQQENQPRKTPVDPDAW